MKRHLGNRAAANVPCPANPVLSLAKNSPEWGS